MNFRAIRLNIALSACLSALIPTFAVADPLKDSLVNLLAAGAEFVSSGYQMSYLDDSVCKRYPASFGTRNGMENSLEEVSMVLRGEMLDGVLKIVDSVKVQLNEGAIQIAGSQPTAFACGKAKGIMDGQFSKLRENWRSAVRDFERNKRLAGVR